jgi:hypothetical protein
VGINNSATSGGSTDIADGSSTGSVGIGNTTGGVTITSTSWSASGATLTAGSSSVAGALVLTDGAVGNTYTLQAATGGAYSPTFLLPVETISGNPYTLATTADLPSGTNFIVNSTSPQLSSNFNITGNGTVQGAVITDDIEEYASGPVTIQHDGGDLELGNNGGTTTLEGAVTADATLTFSTSGPADITGTSNSWSVSDVGAATFASIGGTSPGTGAFTTLSAGSGALTVNGTGTLSTTGNISTTGTGAVTSAGPLTASSTLVYSTEGDVASGTAVTVSGSTVFAAVTGTGTGNINVTVTNTPATGQVLLVYNNTSPSQTLVLNGQYVFPSYTGKFIYYGGAWVLMQY